MKKQYMQNFQEWIKSPIVMFLLILFVANIYCLWSNCSIKDTIMLFTKGFIEGYIAIVILKFIYRSIKKVFKNFGDNSLAYLKPLKKIGLIVLDEDIAKKFSKKIDFILKKKPEYLFNDIIPSEDPSKCYTRYVKYKSKEWYQRLIEMAKAKEIKILHRDGIKIDDFEHLVDYNIYYSLERCFFDELLDCSDKVVTNIDWSNTEGFVRELVAKAGIKFDFSFIEKEKNKYDTDKIYIIEHEDFFSEHVNEVNYNILGESYNRLAKKGYVIVAFYTRGLSDLRFTILKTRTYAKVDRWTKDLHYIGLMNLVEILDETTLERYYTNDQIIENIYKEYKDEIFAEPRETIYRISAKDETPNSFTKFAGKAPVDLKEKHPTFEGKKMEHLISIDLNDFDALKQKYPNTRVITVYLSDFLDNEAYCYIGVDETKVLHFSEEEIDDAIEKGNIDITSGFKIESSPLEVPSCIFDEDYVIYSLDDDDWRAELLEAMFDTSYVGGGVILHNVDYDETLNEIHIMTINEFFGKNLKELNFGGGGNMHIFTDEAFWESL